MATNTYVFNSMRFKIMVIVRLNKLAQNKQTNLARHPPARNFINP